MIVENFDTAPVELLLQRHRAHSNPYKIIFRGLTLGIDPDVFNPTYTKVSGFLADHMEIMPGETVLDMFTGSGAIGLLALKRGAREVVGVDISPLAISCAVKNAEQMGVTPRAKFRQGDLWDAIGNDETFDVITANPPLLPAIPENYLEMAVADSPNMANASRFIRGCVGHMNKDGRTYMAFSNACHVYYDNPLSFVREVASSSKLSLKVKAEWDVGYEVYRILELRHN